MEHYHKLFVKFSLLYFLFGSILGFLIGAGTVDAVSFKFAHVHLNLLGFIGAMIFGVAYHILPRFNGKPLKSQKMVVMHFYMSNIGLIGMVIFYTMQHFNDSAGISAMFYLSALIYAISVPLFVINIMDCMSDEPREIGASDVTVKTSANAILRKWPSVIATFKANGLDMVEGGGFSMIYRTYSIERLCRMKNVDTELFTATIQAAIKMIEKKAAKDGMDAKNTSHAGIIPGKAKPIKRGELCTKDTLIGDLLKEYPETGFIFEKHYGESCFTCPGQAYESIQETAAMHSAELDSILGEVNEVIGQALKTEKTGN